MLKHLMSLGLVLSACGGDDGGSVDAQTAPPMVTVSGTTYSIGIAGRSPLGAVTVEAYKEGGSSPVATVTSGADGTYSLMIPTGGVAVDGYLLGKITGYKDTYLYPPAPLAADTTAGTVFMLTQQTFDAAGALVQETQDPAKGWVAAMIVDAANMPVAGATATSEPAGTKVFYNGTNMLPKKDATATEADGIAYIFNVPAGTATVNAAKSGSTFHSHKLNARAGQVTTTLIQ